jgi:hypothetical protein
MTPRISKQRAQEQVDKTIRDKIGDPGLVRKHYKELGLAERRLGQTPIRILQWLVNFANKELEDLNLIDLQKREYEVAHFSIFGLHPRQDVSPFDLLTDDRSESGWSQHIGRGLTLPNKADLLELQKEVRQFLDQLIDQQHTTIRLQDLRLNIQAVRFESQGFLDVSCSRIQDAFFYHEVPLFTLYAGRLRRCAESDCKNRFLSMRRQQKFCSTTCQSRVATRRYRVNQEEKRKRKTAHTRKEKH